ncbi:MAG TPA: DNRLRE domain-containing protein [Polyangia bacterium]
MSVFVSVSCAPDDGDSIEEQTSALTTTIGMAADSYVRSGAPGSNFGTATTILSDGDDGGSILNAYLRFTIGNVGTISSAKLRLHVANTTAGRYDLLSVASTTWGETSITWNNKPATGALVTSFTGATSGTWLELDITSVARPNTALSFAIVPHNTTDGVDFHSKEASASIRPQVVITSAGAGGTGGTRGAGGTGGAGGRGGAGATSGSGGAAGAAGGGSGAGVCGSTSTPPAHYQHVVIFSFENRTWSNVGLGFSATTMPYMHSLAAQCSYFGDWTETNTSQNSLTQYIGETSGINNPNTVNDCSPSASCRSTDDNIFRQVRTAGKTTVSYVEGATAGCSASGNAVRHIPALYYFGTYTDATGTHSDHDFCNTEVRPYSELDVNNLPTFAFVTPTLCNDGHDCGDATVDAWASTNVQRVLDSAAYKAGTTAVFFWWDEDHPTPNLTIVPTSHKGNITQVGVASHAALLKTIEDMLGLPLMTQGQLSGAADLRSALGI